MLCLSIPLLLFRKAQACLCCAIVLRTGSRIACPHAPASEIRPFQALQIHQVCSQEFRAQVCRALSLSGLMAPAPFLAFLQIPVCGCPAALLPRMRLGPELSIMRLLLLPCFPCGT